MAKETTGKESIYDKKAYKRVPLAEKLPLKTPFSVDYFPVNACNLRCVFCGYASQSEEYKYHKVTVMDFDLFKKSIDDMKKFPEKIKTVHFLGYGEPLLHELLPDMAAYAVKSNVAEKVDVITNGTLLSNKVSDGLIGAKLDWLRISVNGLSSEDYKKNCGVSIDFNKFIDNIAYFHKNRTNTQIYIKIFDYMVATEERKKMFYNIFEPISDALSIEHLGSYVDGVDFDKISKDITGLSTRGVEMPDQKICPMPFYMLHINPDGSCTPCCESKFRVSLGEVSKDSLFDIWNGEKFKRLRRDMLSGVKNVSGICSRCKIYRHATCPEDILDKDADRLKRLYASE